MVLMLTLSPMAHFAAGGIRNYMTDMPETVCLDIKQYFCLFYVYSVLTPFIDQFLFSDIWIIKT